MKKIFISLFLITLGTFRPIADLFGLEAVSAVGTALNISPSMKVFTSHNGYETFSSKFFIHLTWNDGLLESHEISHSLYKKLKGPYNRRNVYGAIFSYGPLLITSPYTKPMFDNVTQNGFCKSTRLLDELNINRTNRKLIKVTIEVQQQTKKQRTDLPKLLEMYCG